MAATILVEDLETYVGQYGPKGAIQRLQFIASKTEQRSLKIEACKLCLHAFKRTTDAKGYREMHALLKDLTEGSDTPLPHYDAVWVEATQKQSAILRDLYEQDLSQAKGARVKETIRTCHVQLTRFCMEQGDYASALQYLTKSREYCTDPESMYEDCITSIRLAALLMQYSDIQIFASKAQKVGFGDDTSQSSLSAAQGLVHLTAGRYKDAAYSFVHVKHQDIVDALGDVLCPQDVALYGVLCALASLERDEVKSKLLHSPSFQECLDLMPQIRDLALDFCDCRYGACLSALDRLRAPLSLDVHLHEQVSDICAQIRSRGIIQYFVPFMSVSLHSMAATFNTDTEGIQREVAQLVSKRQLDAKIDSRAKILHVRQANQRSAVYNNTMRVSQDFLDSAQALILRMNLLKHDFGVHLVRQKK